MVNTLLLTDRVPTTQLLERWGLSAPWITPYMAESKAYDTILHVITSDEHSPVIMKLPYLQQYFPVYRALSRRKGSWGLHRVQCLPLPATRSLKGWVRDVFPPHLLGIRHADFVLCAGTVAESHVLIGPATAKLQTCAPDVLRFAEIDRDQPPHMIPYAVMLDEATDKPHEDYQRLGIAPPNPWVYRDEMMRLYEAIGKRLKLSIGIQPHPEWGSPLATTPTTIFHSSLVLAHSSTSISFAVLMDKPVWILCPPCYHGRFEEKNALAMATALDTPFVCTPQDVPYQGNRVGNPNLRAYHDYADRYLIAPGAKARKPSEVLEEWLTKKEKL